MKHSWGFALHSAAPAKPERSANFARGKTRVFRGGGTAHEARVAYSSYVAHRQQSREDQLLLTSNAHGGTEPAGGGAVLTSGEGAEGATR